MLQSVDVVPPPGVTWPAYSMPVLNQFPDLPFYIKSVEGLNPPPGTINTADSDQDDDHYLGGRTSKRNIVLKLGLNYPLSSARGTIGNYFRVKGEVWLSFVSTDSAEPPKKIQGYVETIEDDHFTDDPEVVISIICPKSDFLGQAIDVTGTAGITPAAVDAHTNGSKDSPFELTADLGFGGTYSGDVRIQQFNPGSGVPMREFVVTGISCTAAKELYFSSLRGKKRIEVRNKDGTGTPTVLLGAMDLSVSFWLVLFPGENQIKVVLDTDYPVKSWELKSVERFGSLL